MGFDLSASFPQPYRHLFLHHFHHQDLLIYINRYTENTVPDRSGSVSEELRGDTLHESKETKFKNVNGECEEV